jgi:hypothetical protein
MGKEEMSDDNLELAKWALGRHVGASSRCIARHMIGQRAGGEYPHDAGDFERCETLLDAVPSYRARLGEMASVNAYWAALVPQWEAIRAAPDKHAAIQAIVRSIEDADQRFFRLGAHASLRGGPPVTPDPTAHGVAITLMP